MGPERSYRGKRLDNKKWWYGSYLFLHVRDRDWTGKEVGKAEDVHYIVDDQDINYAVSPETIGLDTGLTDKNGVKIFEGDIVAWRDKNFILNGHYTYGFDGYKYGDELIVRCLKSGFMLCKKHDGMPDTPNANAKIDNYAFWNYHRFLEVIGNIHDNPELLEVQNGTTDMET